MPFRSGFPSAVRNTLTSGARPSTGERIICETAIVPPMDTSAMAAPFSQFCIGSPGALIGRPRGTVSRATATERVRNGAVAFVTGVLEELVIRFPVQRHRHFPGRGEDLRILDRHLVIDRVLVDAREAFDRVQLLALRDRANALRGD